MGLFYDCVGVVIGMRGSSMVFICGFSFEGNLRRYRKRVGEMLSLFSFLSLGRMVLGFVDSVEKYCGFIMLS